MRRQTDQPAPARANRRCRWMSLCAIGLCLAGCAKPAGVIFPPLDKPLAWPGGSEPDRIRYVGQLVTSVDLKPAVPFGQGLVDALFGKKDINSMLTPYALCTDGAQRLFVADTNAQFVHVFDLERRTYEQWRPPKETPFSQPVGIAYDPAGRLFVADSIAACVFVFDASGKPMGHIGSGLLSRPCGIAYDPSNSRLLVADTAAHQLIALSATGQLLARIGQRGTELGEFNYPTNVAVDTQGRIYVSDSLNFRVQQLSPDLKPLRQIGRKGDMPGYFSHPKGLALDSQDHLYVVDANFEAVQIFNSSGTLLMDFGEEGQGPGEFWLPAGIFIDRLDRIWIADSYNRRVQVFDYVPENKP